MTLVFSLSTHSKVLVKRTTALALVNMQTESLHRWPGKNETAVPTSLINEVINEGTGKSDLPMLCLLASGEMMVLLRLPRLLAHSPHLLDDGFHSPDKASGTPVNMQATQ